MPKDEALEDFDRARKEWEASFVKAPDEALGYLKPGDDYALGGLEVHVNWVLVHYRRVLDALIAGGFTPLSPLDRPGEADEANAKAKVGLTAAGRRQALVEMDGLHKAVVEAVEHLADERWSHKAPVVYGAGQDPYPTSVEDIIGWLSDHYREHVQQCTDLIAAWRDQA